MQRSRNVLGGKHRDSTGHVRELGTARYCLVQQRLCVYRVTKVADRDLYYSVMLANRVVLAGKVTSQPLNAALSRGSFSRWFACGDIGHKALKCAAFSMTFGKPLLSKSFPGVPSLDPIIYLPAFSGIAAYAVGWIHHIR